MQKPRPSVAVFSVNRPSQERSYGAGVARATWCLIRAILPDLFETFRAIAEEHRLFSCYETIAPIGTNFIS